MRYLFLITVLVIFHFRAYSNECLFEAKVHPPEKTEATKELYHEACRFFTKTFGVKLNPKIKLNNVHYVEKEEDWKSLVDADIAEDNALGVFYSPFHDPETKTVNDIYINTRGLFSKLSPFVKDQNKIMEQSFVLHEFIHFFIKSAKFEYVLENNIERNGIMEEALCHWASNKYIEKATQDRKNITDYMKADTEEFVLSDDFPSISRIIYRKPLTAFIYNSIHFFDSDTRAKYNKLINNEYTMSELSDPYL